jgi:hypothetical protein
MPFFPNPRKLVPTKKKGFEILKFVDFHFKFVDFVCRDSTVKCSFLVNLQVRQTNMDHCCTLSACYNFDNSLIS